MRVHSNSFPYYCQWLWFGLVLYLSRWNFDSVPGHCVCLTHAPTHYKHLFSILYSIYNSSLLFQTECVSIKFVLVLNGKKWIFPTSVQSGASDSIPWHPLIAQKHEWKLQGLVAYMADTLEMCVKFRTVYTSRFFSIGAELIFQFA